MDSPEFTFPVPRTGFEEAEGYILNHAWLVLVPQDILVTHRISPCCLNEGGEGWGGESV
jgi:hypothetical protein